MSLQVYLPLNGDLHNQGCSGVTVTNNGATVNTSGKIGSCYAFNGSTGYIALSGDELFKIFTGGAQQFSITMWVFHADTTRAILFGDYATSGGIGFNIELSTAHGVRFYWNGSPDTYPANATVTASGWTHVALTYDGTKLQSYINGVEKGSWSGTLATKNKTSGEFRLGRDNRSDSTAFNGRINDFRIYDHALSAAEVKEISQGLVLHYKLDGMDTPNINLGGTSADYNNKTEGQVVTASAWGGDAGSITFHHSGGYAGLPYKEYHKTATGSGGIYAKTANDINLEANTTYTMSCWIKGSRAFNASQHTFNINRGSDNLYITYGTTIPITTDWQFFSKTFTTTDTQNGAYGEMSIVYDDGATDYYVYYSGFKIEKGSTATRWTPPGIQYTTVQDSSGYGHNGSTLNTVSISSDTPRYSASVNLPATNSMINCGRGGMVTDSITVNIWLKSSAWANPVSCTEGGGWNFEASGDYFRFPVYVSGVGYKYGQSSTTKAQICNNQWHMLTGIYDRLNQKVQIYVDGQLDNDYAAGTSNNIGYNGSNVIWIGAEATGSNTTASNGMVGLFSDFRIYATALSADDILSLYHTSAKVDNLGGFHTFELSETNNGLELLAVPLTTSYGNRTNIYTNYNTNGEITLTGSSSIGSDYIKINPTDKTYYYDFELSIDANNQIYLGFERFDAAKTSRSNSACMYAVAVKPSTAVSHAHYHGTINIGTPFDANTPVDTIAVRILNDWSSANGRSMTVHKMSLREVSTLQNTKINKQGQTIITELIEMNDKFRIQKNGIIETNEFLEL